MKTSYRLSETAFQLDGKMPLKQAIPLGLQHVLAMFVGNLTPLLIITGACGLAGGEFAGLQLHLLQNAMLVAGIVTLVQLFSIGPIGGKVPIIMGTSSGFIGVFNSVAATMGGGVIAYGAIMGASIIGGLFEGVLGFFLKPLRKFFPAVVTGTVVMSIGLSLISVGINSFGGGNTAKDFGSMENLLLALFVLVMILVFKHGSKGFASSSAILLGIICGYAAAFVMGFVLPTTGVTAEGVEYTKAWVLNWSKVANAAWFEIPKLMPVKPVFDLRAILPVLIMFVVTAVETVGDISGVMEGGLNREATDKELSGGVIQILLRDGGHGNDRESGGQRLIHLPGSRVAIVHSGDKPGLRAQGQAAVPRHIHAAAKVQHRVHHRQSLIFRHIDLVQHPETALSAALVHRAGPEGHFSLLKGVGAHQGGRVGVDVEGNVPHRPQEQRRQILGQHVFPRGLAAGQQQILAAEHRRQGLLPNLLAIIGIPGHGDSLRITPGIGVQKCSNLPQNLRIYPFLLQKIQYLPTGFQFPFHICRLRAKSLRLSYIPFCRIAIRKP